MSGKYPYIDAYRIGLKKKIGLERQLGSVVTLILGNSHGEYAYVPRRGEYNLCLPSQDLYYSYALYEKYGARLILLDINLPGIDGFSVCEKLRRNDNVPIMIITLRENI